MNIVNITPHAINVVKADGTVQTFKPDGTVARVAVAREVVQTVDGIVFNRPTFGKPVGVPAPVEGTVFIVSAMVREAMKDRKDIVSPGEPVRNSEGQIIGCKGFDTN